MTETQSRQSQDLGTIESAVGAQIVVDGRRLINFGGSSYLGLSTQPRILAAGLAMLRQCGSGVPFPPNHGLVLQAHRDVEREAIHFFGSQAALYTAGGYFFGLAAIAAIQEQFSVVFCDELSHFALQDAMAASRLPSHAFRHLDPEDLRRRLQQLRAGERPLIVTDGMFSTFGAIAPLAELAELAARYGGRVLVDESHSFGVLGARGRGAAEHHDIPDSIIIRGGSLGKAFGTCGGLVLGSEAEIAAARRTRVGRGASQGLPAGAAMCAESLRYVREHPERLKRLRSNVTYMKNAMRALGLDIPRTIAPVASFVPPPEKTPEVLKAELMSRGIFVYHSTYIGAGVQGVIRCGIFADHTTEHIDRLIEALRSLL